MCSIYGKQPLHCGFLNSLRAGIKTYSYLFPQHLTHRRCSLNHSKLIRNVPIQKSRHDLTDHGENRRENSNFKSPFLGHTRMKGNTNTNLATLQNTCWEVLEPGTPKQGRARNGG